jgi:hypothetical protein
MKAVECLAMARDLGEHWQLAVNQFIDDFRRANLEERANAVIDAIESSGPLEGLIAGVVSGLCRETRTEPPPWIDHIGSPDPFFAFPARSFEMRLRLMLESPPPFRIRNVFVPATYLSRA